MERLANAGVLLVGIPGIGEATTLSMLIEMPELGTIENNA